MRNALPALLLLVATGCAHNLFAQPKPVCDLAEVQQFVGRVGTPEVAKRAQRRARADDFRWLRPGFVTTAEHRANRLNGVLDRQGRITAFRCG